MKFSKILFLSKKAREKEDVVMQLTQLQLPFLEFKKAEEEREKIKWPSKTNEVLSFIGVGVTLTAMTVYFLKFIFFEAVRAFNRKMPMPFTTSAIDYVCFSVFVVFFGLFIIMVIIDVVKVRKVIKTIDNN